MNLEATNNSLLRGSFLSLQIRQFKLMNLVKLISADKKQKYFIHFSILASDISHSL